MNKAPLALKKIPKRSIQAIAFLLIAFISAGCAVKFAPDYDKAIVEGLNEANQQTLVLFASVSQGAKKESFTERKAAYNEIIGKFDAIRLQVKARPTPRPYINQIFGIGPSIKLKPEDIETLKAPTEEILQNIVNTLTRMRDTDEKGTLTQGKVVGLKDSYEQKIGQALTYENALER